MTNGVLNHAKLRFQAVFEDTFPRVFDPLWDWDISAGSLFSRNIPIP